MSAQARSYTKGIFPPAYDSAGGLDEGDTTQFTSPATDGTPQAIKHSGTAPWLQTFYGVVMHRGTIGGSGSAAGDAIAVVRQGLARIKQAYSTSVTRGAQLIANASNLGTVSARTKYSFSAKVIGHAEEAQTTGASGSNMLEAYIQPYDIEIVRTVGGFASGNYTAGATRYGAGTGNAVSSTRVPLYVARHTGEVLRNLRINSTTAPASGETLVGTFEVSSDNGATWSAASWSVTVSGTDKSSADLSNTVTLTAGDLVVLKFVGSNNGSFAAADIAYQFDVT